jgi:hypothetical protein
MGGAQTGFSFGAEKKNQNEISEKIDLNSADSLKDKKILPKRDFSLSDDDLKAHQEFITNYIKNNLWGF